jgi:glutaredoxin
MMTKAVLERLGVAYEEIDIDQDSGAAATVLAINGSSQRRVITLASGAPR